jgi:hypothetical protein
MALSTRKRNYIIGAALAVVVIAALLLILIRSCGEEEYSTAGTVAKTMTAAQTVAQTATRTTAATKTATQSTTETPETGGASGAPASPPAAPEPAPAAEPPLVVDRYVNPENIDPGQLLTFTVKVKGTALAVTVTATRHGNSDPSFSLPLVQGATVGDTTSWSAGTTSATDKGIYRWRVYTTAGDGAVVETPGMYVYTFCVGDPAVDCVL